MVPLFSVDSELQVAFEYSLFLTLCGFKQKKIPRSVKN